MGIKDLTEKILEDYNDIFADIVNVLVFKGKQRIKPETLVNTGVHSQYKNDKTGVLHEQERDVAKYWMNGKVRIALCGLENQTAVESKMPLRVFGYEGTYPGGWPGPCRSGDRIRRNPDLSTAVRHGLRRRSHARPACAVPEDRLGCRSPPGWWLPIRCETLTPAPPSVPSPSSRTRPWGCGRYCHDR